MWSIGLLWLLGTLTVLCAQTVRHPPSSHTGPSGSTYTTAFTWRSFQLAAFVDLNTDRQMDVILLDPAGKQLYASIAPDSKSSLAFGTNPSDLGDLPFPVLLLSPGLAHPIVSVVPADYNGDSIVDLLLVTATSHSGPFDVYVAYGVKGSQRGSFAFNKQVPVANFTAQPMICDLNSDAIADIFGEVSPTERLIVFGGSELKFQTVPYSGPRWSKLGYSAFGDVNGDTIPDVLILLVGVPQTIQLIYRNFSSDPGRFDMSHVEQIELPDALIGSAHLTLGLFVLADFDTDGRVELLLPACTTLSCQDSSYLFIYNFKQRVWSSVEVMWHPKDESSTYPSWSLAPTPSLTSTDALILTSRLVGPTVGDVDLDGKPDVAVGLAYRSTSGDQMGIVPAILLNEGMNNHKQLRFQAYLLPKSSLPTADNQMRQIAFFHNREKGTLDTFVVSWNTHESLPSVSLLVQHMTNDFYFLKVTILNGLCASADTCADKRLPYGLPVPGQSSFYSTESSEGSQLMATGLITTQSCCSALQLPSILYGLGPFANYVDRLKVAIPPVSTDLRELVIPAVVPNSEVFVNPHPHDQPSRWTAKLFLQPLYNMKVLYIAITLICVCVVLIIIISILLYLEVREDRLEKLKEAQRFHFDAM